jgi:hypothetical protein
VSFIAQEDLRLTNTTCQDASFSIDSNVLQFEIDATAINRSENCFIYLGFTNAALVNYALPISYTINSSLYANLSVVYTAESIRIRNNGTGRGVAWVCLEDSTVSYKIEPGKFMELIPRGLLRISLDSNCSSKLFEGNFFYENEEFVEEKAEKNKTIWLFTLPIFLVGVVTILYFASRFSTFFKYTRR